MSIGYSITEPTKEFSQNLVLIHGVGLDRNMWKSLVPQIADHVNVISYDFLGHGESELPSEEAALDEYVTQFIDLIDKLKLETVHILGFSMGALIAQAIAATYPERVNKLIVLNTVFKRLNTVFKRDSEQREQILGRLETLKKNGLEASYDAALKRWFQDEPNHPNIPWIRERMLSNNFDGYLRSYRRFALADSEIDIDAIQAEALVMTGELDGNSTPAMSQQLASQLMFAKALIIPKQHHMMPMTASDTVAKHVLEFLS